MIHELKILPKYFNDVVKGVKTFEIRKDDRNFKIGYILLLEEYDSNNEYVDINDNLTNYSGRKIVKEITYIFKYIDGLNNDYTLLRIKTPNEDVKLEWSNDMIEWGEISLYDEWVMTYYPNGSMPYNSYSNPYMTEDGDIYFHNYDHDVGCWIEDKHLINHDEYNTLNEIKAIKVR